MPTPTRDTVSGEALFILKNLRDNSRLGRSNKLAEVKTALEPNVSLEFDSYFFFLRKFHYIAMDREAQLKLTETGEKVVDSGVTQEFSEDIYEFFADQIVDDDSTAAGQDDVPMGDEGFSFPPPPPPMSDEDEELIPTTGPEPMPSIAPMAMSMSLSTPIPQAAPTAPSPASRPQPPMTTMPPIPLPPSAMVPPKGAPSFSSPAPSPMAPPPPAAVTAQQLQQTQAGQPNQPKAAGDGDLRYVKFDAMGAGPLGTVFKGRHNALGTDICVKELKDIFGYFSFLQRGEVIKRLK
jgi:hypothetical protein